MTIFIHVPAVPVAQPRPRATIRGHHAAVYSPAKHPVEAFKATVRMAAHSTLGPFVPLDGPLSVDIVFVFPRPKNRIWKTKPMPRERHTKKPDRDNCDKGVLDALSGLLWIDDCQVCAGSIEKWIASGDEQPHVTITVIRLDVT